ncbi:MAG: glycosyltransferase family 2 protein [Bacteroidetes bacterium]|nr:glycosyltransferase family 2 protein [Bacteroidota bacterium]
MSVTIVIPSRNRAAKLSTSLAALEKQTVSGFKVIVVDDGSTTEEQQQYDLIVSRSPLHIQLIHQTNKGIAGATNAGIALAQSGLIILLDDDIVTRQNHVALHIAHHSKYPGSLVSGTAETVIHEHSAKLDTYKVYMEENWSRNAFGNREGLIRLAPENFTITAANMSFSADTFQKLGPFDESLRDCQDFEMGLRALRKEIPVYFDKQIRAIHNDGFTLEYFARRQRSYQLNTLKVLEKYPEYQSYFNIQKPPAASQWFKRMVYALLRKKQVVKFVEHSKLFGALPQKLRYRVYGSTLAALSFSE